MIQIFKSKSLFVIASLISSMMFFSCQKDNVNDTPEENLKQTNFDTAKAETAAYFSIQAPNGNYLSSENGNKPVNAIRNTVGSWEKFEFIDIGGRKVIIKGSNGKYLTQLERTSNGTQANNYLSCTASREDAEEFFTHNSGSFPQFSFTSLTHSGVKYALTSDAKKLASNSFTTTFTLQRQ
ncbi:hypothetical protein [Aquimarina sp. RZ0]|uniref:hypothetical protein n=1 Tax=Aquimarina sp. RZ0 TaxID=2607730 RepID=UPI0011F2A535|nr:hypothetical protein [Aquimarina sp. RZ0]KAA1243566.1 hypothetical protein F0000_20375 [Aquimarina sp. RZ0]